MNRVRLQHIPQSQQAPLLQWIHTRSTTLNSAHRRPSAYPAIEQPAQTFPCSFQNILHKTSANPRHIKSLNNGFRPQDKSPWATSQVATIRIDKPDFHLPSGE